MEVKDINIDKTLENLSGLFDTLYECGVLTDEEKELVNNTETELCIWINAHKGDN